MCMANLEAGSSPELFSSIARRNLAEIRDKYGDGVKENKREQDLEYHNELHTLDVMQNVKTLIGHWNKEFPDEPITAREEMLLEFAASGHDIVQGTKENERLSADQVSAAMREAGGFT